MIGRHKKLGTKIISGIMMVGMALLLRNGGDISAYAEEFSVLPTIIENQNSLSVSGSAVVSQDAMVIEEPTELEYDMVVSNLTINAPLSLNGHTLTVHGDVIVRAKNQNQKAVLMLDGGSLICKGDIHIVASEYAYFQMMNDEDYVLIEGNFFMECDTSYISNHLEYDYFSDYQHRKQVSTLNHGILELKGDLHTELGTMFMCTGEHTIIFSGDKLQKMDIKSMLCHFASVSYQNTSQEGICANKFPTADKEVGSDILIKTSEYEGWTLEQNEYIDGDFYLDGGELNLNGYKLFVNGDFIHSSGTVKLNGGYLEVAGIYCMATYDVEDGNVVCKEGTGSIVMTDPTDYLKIFGDF